jgi:YidC/Oxa1 family membrane protein insertase
MTPEQELQQKMIKYMMVFMFPVMMYNAPSGLAIYFITNSVLGILESRWIKAHIEKHKLLEIKKPTGGAGGGFLARLQKMAEDRQRQMGQASKRQPPPGGKRTR